MDGSPFPPAKKVVNIPVLPFVPIRTFFFIWLPKSLTCKKMMQTIVVCIFVQFYLYPAQSFGKHKTHKFTQTKFVDKNIIVPYFFQELEIVIGDEHISFTTSKIGSLVDVNQSK